MIEPTLYPNTKDAIIAHDREYFVVKGNDIIQYNSFAINKNAGNSLSLYELKIISCLISRIKPKETQFTMQEFSIQDFCKLCGIYNESGRVYERIKEAITKLARRVIWLETPEKEFIARWIDNAEIIKGKGIIKLKLDDKLRPYLLQLYDNRTQYPLHNIIRMKSKYGVMLYELLRSYYFKYNTLHFDVEDLKIRLDATEYANFTNFRKRVIEPALNDINTYSELKVTVKYIKTGRVYTEAVFYMQDLQESKLPEAREEARTRYLNTERELDQATIFDLIDDI